MHDGDLQVNSFESADVAHDEFHDDLRRFKLNLDAAKNEHARHMVETKRLSTEVKRISLQGHRFLNQMKLKTLFVESVKKPLVDAERFIQQWTVHFKKIQHQLNEAVNSFKNPGWIELFFSWFEFPTARKASQNAVARLELLLKSDTNNDPYKAYANLQQTIENILSSDTITYRLKWRLENSLVEMKNHSLPALTTDSRFSDITKALTKPNPQDVRKNYQTVFHPVEIDKVGWAKRSDSEACPPIHRY